MHIIASIQARLGSTRLPGKVLYHLGERRVLQWVIDRAEDAKTVDKTAVAVGDQPENDAITEYCKRSDIEYIVGPEDNLLKRHLTVAEETKCDLLVRLTADCPFVPSDEIDQVVEEHLSNEARYTTNATSEMPIGTAVDVIEPKLLSDLKDLGETHPVKLARSNPDDWGTVFTENHRWSDIADAHLAVDTPDDYWSLVDALDAVGDEPRGIGEWLVK